MKTIGPNFSDELAVAGLSGQPFSWTAEGELFFSEDASQALKDAVQAVLDAHDPEAAAPAPVLQVVSRFQGREAMWQTPHGETTLFEAAETVINDPETPPMYKRAWAELQEFRRDSEMLLAIAGILDLSSSDLDDLFILADSIKA